MSLPYLRTESLTGCAVFEKFKISADLPMSLLKFFRLPSHVGTIPLNNCVCFSHENFTVINKGFVSYYKCSVIVESYDEVFSEIKETN